MRHPNVSFLSTAVFGLLIIASSLVSISVAQKETEVFVWSSTGGGLRAMFACIGYSNIFRQAGLFEVQHEGSTSSRFAQIATTSGASWFNTQLFYSKAFYEQTVVAQNPQDLYDFTIQWMNSYLELTLSAVAADDEAETLDDITNTSDLEQGGTKESIEFLEIARYFNRSWATCVAQILQAGAVGYGGSFSDIEATLGGRLEQLRNTDMLVQTSLAPTARTRTDSSDGFKPNSTISINPLMAIGPSDGSGDLYTTPLSAAYIVNSTYNGFQYSTFDSPSTGQVDVFIGSTPTTFDFGDWDDYFLFPAQNGSIIARDSPISEDPPTAITRGMNAMNAAEATTMPIPFGNAAKLSQLAAASSAADGTASPRIPSVFAQRFSQTRASIQQAEKLTKYDLAVDRRYDSPKLDEVAVCSQWPNECGPTNGWFIDGGKTDNPTVAINVAHYHQRLDSDLSKTLKMVVTNTNQNMEGATIPQFLQYFSTYFNHDIPPGDYVWMPSSQNPRRSPQFLEDALTKDDFLAAMLPIDGSNMSTAIFKGTTLANPAFGIRAGQRFEVLLLNLNEPIPTLIFGSTAINETMVPLAEMSLHIASNQELLRRVQDFFGLADEGDDVEGGSDKGVTSHGADSIASMRGLTFSVLAATVGLMGLLSQ